MMKTKTLILTLTLSLTPLSGLITFAGAQPISVAPAAKTKKPTTTEQQLEIALENCPPKDVKCIRELNSAIGKARSALSKSWTKPKTPSVSEAALYCVMKHQKSASDQHGCMQSQGFVRK
jgi:hypothetical protein